MSEFGSNNLKVNLTFSGSKSVVCLSIQRAMRELVDSGRYDTHDNFTVVLQPFIREVFLPKLEVRANIPPALNVAKALFYLFKSVYEF